MKDKSQIMVAIITMVAHPARPADMQAGCLSPARMNSFRRAGRQWSQEAGKQGNRDTGKQGNRDAIGGIVADCIMAKTKTSQPDDLPKAAILYTYLYFYQ